MFSATWPIRPLEDDIQDLWEVGCGLRDLCLAGLEQRSGLMHTTISSTTSLGPMPTICSGHTLTTMSTWVSLAPMLITVRLDTATATRDMPIAHHARDQVA